MKRREFLVASAGFAGAMVPLIGTSATVPCPPGRVSATGGTTVQTVCAATSGVADWQARANAANVVVAYDFSAPPANGGDFKWGSLRASPKITCEAPQHTYDTQPAPPPAAQHVWRSIDTSIYPPGSTASLCWNVPGLSGEAGDQWRLSIDNYDDQFGPGSPGGNEFWVQWRTRMNPTYATYMFQARNNTNTGPEGYTTFKHSFWGGGMQFPYSIEGSPAPYYGYQGPGTQDANNTMSTTRTDSAGEIVLIGSPQIANASVPANMKYPLMYISKNFDNATSRGQDISYFTNRNGGNESAHVAMCQFTNPGGGVGNQYTDYSTCFIYPSNQWFALMTHTIVGPYAVGAIGSLGGTAGRGYAGSTIEYYGQLTPGTPWMLLHRRTNVLLRTDNNGAVGGQGFERYGMFGWTTFMTGKWIGDNHPLAQIWVSQIIISKGTAMPAAPAI